MKRIIGVLVALGALALPGVASAHTGTVTCDSSGVTFQYHANFERTTAVLETVNGQTRTVIVQRWQALTDTWAGIAGTATAGAMWTNGSIPTVALTCPAPPAPPATPPVTPPPATPVTTPPPAAPAAPPAVAPAIVPATLKPKPPKKHTPARCPKHTLNLGLHEGVRMCLRVVHIPAHKVRGAVAHGARTPRHGAAGVTG